MVNASLRAHAKPQGYEGIMHGGVVAAMTHCLSHRGIKGLAGDLHVKFVRSISCNAHLKIRASVESHRRSRYRLKAKIECDGKLMEWAEATFIRHRTRDHAVEGPGRAT